MKNLVPFLLVFLSIGAFAQTKEQAYQDMAKLLKKLDGRSYIFDDGSGDKFKIHKQTLTPDKFQIIAENPTTGKVTNTYGVIPWSEVTEIEVDTMDIKAKINSVTVNFKNDIPVAIILHGRDGQDKTIQRNNLSFDVYAEDVEKFKKLITILTNN